MTRKQRPTELKDPAVKAKLTETTDDINRLQPVNGNGHDDLERETENKILERLSADDEETMVVPYRPYAGMERWFKNRFSAWNTPKAWFAMTLIILFFACGGPGLILENIVRFLASPGGITNADAMTVARNTNTAILQILSLSLLAVISVVGYIYARHPSHLAFSARGISLIWHRGLLWRARLFSWQNVETIQVVWPPGKTSPSDSLISFSMNNGPPLNLRFGALSTIDSRQALLKAIEKWGGGISRAPELSEMLAPPQNHNYTELWLQALSAPPKRERLTPLPEGAMLREGRYTAKGQLGVGGQGTAYLAFANDVQHEVVLKEFILPVYVDANIRRQALEKMQHEAEILGKLDNERIVKLIDFFIEDHRGYLVLERIDGASLRQRVTDEGAMTEDRVRKLAFEMCQMLEYLHGLTPPVVHRDFTPDNLILEHGGILKLVDFNVAQQKESTATGTVVGKHCYISPEQFRGKPTPQSDIYAMGATLFYLLVGDDPEPITASKPKKLLPELSDGLNDIIARATALDSKNRYQSISELKSDLAHLDQERDAGS